MKTCRNDPVVPPVRVVVANGVEDVTIIISYKSGGFCRSKIEGVWTYLVTTAKLPTKQLLSIADAVGRGNRQPISGFGYGLLLSRRYARYWGGELELSSMQGYGTDAYSKLVDKKECLTTWICCIIGSTG